MAIVILMAAADAASKREEAKETLKKIKEYIPKDMELPTSLSFEFGDPPHELVKLGKDLSCEKTEQGKKALIIKTVESLIAAEKFEKEGNRGRDKSLSRLPRRLDGQKGRLELLHKDNTEELFSLFQLNGDRLAKEVGRENIPTSLEATEQYIQYVNGLFKTNTGFSYGIKTHLGRLVGEISLSPAIQYNHHIEALKGQKANLSSEQRERLVQFLKERRHKIYELGFWVGEEFSNQGYITESAKTLSNIALKDLFAEFVIINTQKINQAAKAVAQKLHFVLEPQQFNNQGDMVTYSKSNRSGLGNLILGKKLISDKHNP